MAVFLGSVHILLLRSATCVWRVCASDVALVPHGGCISAPPVEHYCYKHVALALTPLSLIGGYSIGVLHDMDT